MFVWSWLIDWLVYVFDFVSWIIDSANIILFLNYLFYVVNMNNFLLLRRFDDINNLWTNPIANLSIQVFADMFLQNRTSEDWSDWGTVSWVDLKKKEKKCLLSCVCTIKVKTQRFLGDPKVFLAKTHHLSLPMQSLSCRKHPDYLLFLQSDILVAWPNHFRY